MLERVYWRLAKDTGWTYRQIDRVRLEDFDEIAGQWIDEARASGASNESSGPAPAFDPTPKFLNDEDMQKLIAREKAYAESSRGSPYR